MNDITVRFIVGPEKPETQYGIDCSFPGNWFEIDPVQLWEMYINPAVNQLRQQAAYHTHQQPCECLICGGEIDQFTPGITAPPAAEPGPVGPADPEPSDSAT